MRVIHNERAVYLIFPNDAANIQHSADELAQIARGVEDEGELWRPILHELMELERKMKADEKSDLQATAGKEHF